MTIEEVREKYHHQLMTYPNVIMTALGQRRKNNIPVNQPVITVFVLRKISEASLQPHEIIPKQLDGYETDVVVTGGILRPLE